MRSECSNMAEWLGRAQALADAIAEWERLALTPGTTFECMRNAYLEKDNTLTPDLHVCSDVPAFIAHILANIKKP